MVCIAALVVIVVIGVYRIHATHQEESREDEDVARDPAEDWDKSSLTITVNPMEVCIRFLWCLSPQCILREIYTYLKTGRIDWTIEDDASQFNLT